MNLQIQSRSRRLAGFSLIETAVGMAIFGVVFVALHSGLGSSFLTVQMTREDVRATQIMVGKLDTIRLYGWDKLMTPGYVPTNFQAAYYPDGTLISPGSNGYSTPGLSYNGTVAIEKVALAEPYSNDLRQVTVKLVWQTGKVQRNAEMSTFVSRYGLQKYVY